MPPNAAPSDHIGTRIKYWRRRRNGMSQTVLAGQSGLSQSYISPAAPGPRSADRRSILVAIAEALKVSPADLLGRPGDPDDPLRAVGVAVIPTIRASLVEIEEGERRAPTRGPDEMAGA